MLYFTVFLLARSNTRDIPFSNILISKKQFLCNNIQLLHLNEINMRFYGAEYNNIERGKAEYIQSTLSVSIYCYIVTDRILLLTRYCYWSYIVNYRILWPIVYCRRSYTVRKYCYWPYIVSDCVLLLTVYCYWPYIVTDGILLLIVYQGFHFFIIGGTS